MEIIIVGAGKLGRGVAKNLSEENHNVTVVETDEEQISKLVDELDVQGVCGSGTQVDILKEAGIADTKLVVAVTMSDEVNILCCMISKKLGCPATIARVRNPEYAKQLSFMQQELGISLMINPDHTAAHEISKIIQFPSAVNIESFADGIIDLAEIKISPGSPLEEEKLSRISEKFKNQFLICAVERKGEVIIPNGDFVIRAGDKIHITGSHHQLLRMTKAFGIYKSRMKNVMIIGGSRTAHYLAASLSRMNKNVVLIEKNRQVCDQLCRIAGNAVVVCGDANDQDFLLEERIEDMDVVVALTDADETNFLISVFAESLNIPKCVTKINNPNLGKMLDNLNRDSHIDVTEISVNRITQYVRAKKNANSSYMRTLHKLVDGRVEAAEFMADSYVRFLGVPLRELKLKKNILIAAIRRKEKLIFPGGDDSIQKNDLIIVITLGRKLHDLNDILS